MWSLGTILVPTWLKNFCFNELGLFLFFFICSSNPILHFNWSSHIHGYKDIPFALPQLTFFVTFASYFTTFDVNQFTCSDVHIMCILVSCLQGALLQLSMMGMANHVCITYKKKKKIIYALLLFSFLMSLQSYMNVSHGGFGT